MRSRTNRLRIWGVLGLFLALAVVVVFVYGQVPIRPIAPIPPPPRTPADTGALRWFLEKLACCFEIPIDMVRPYPRCTFPAGDYCLYYSGDPGKVPLDGRSFHTFGWYSETLRCGALYPIVRGDSYSRHDQSRIPGLDPYAILPCCDKGWGLRIPAVFGEIGFWLNNPYPPTGAFIGVGGHYFTCTPRNWDGRQHAFIYEAHYVLLEVCRCCPTPVLVKCECDCGCILPPKGKMYLIFWEDWCEGGDWDWNDFMVALIPCLRRVPGFG